MGVNDCCATHILVFVPYTKDFANLKAEFVLQDSEENDVYRNAIALPTQIGVINVPLPFSVISLQVGETYRWFFKVYCTDQQAPIRVDGIIQRVNLNLSTLRQLEAAQPRPKIVIYATNGIWFEALTMLAKLRQANPNDASLATDWQSLLQSIKLGDIAVAPILK